MCYKISLFSQIPGKHHETGYKDSNDRRPIWNAAGLRDFTYST